MRLVPILAVVAFAAAAQKPPYEEAEAAISQNDAAAVRRTFGGDALKKGVAVATRGGSFLLAVESESEPAIVIGEAAAQRMRRIAGSNIWVHGVTLRTGEAHAFRYVIDGKSSGGRTDVPAYGPESYESPGVPRGTLSEKFLHTSKIYEGMESEYWVWAPAQYDPKQPAALMVWQDGQGMVSREASRSQIVFENLTAQKRIPVIVHVFIAPGKTGSRAMRSIEYDTVNDTYARFLRDEILPEVYKRWNIRRDGYSRAIAGNSSGGICAFNAAWHQPDQFSRVLSRIGSFTSIQWRPGQIDGGNVYPFKIRKEPKRNVRVWLQDGANDLENDHGSWPLQNVQMANSLKLKGYDFHLSWGSGTHNRAAGDAELPQALAWLWRDYDPAKTEQTYEMESEERSKPLFRVRLVDR